MKVETKAELRQQIEALSRHNAALTDKLEAERTEMWQRRLPEATRECKRQLNKVFPNQVFNLRYEHVDASGYWFTFELSNDTRRQTYAVRHEDIEKE